MANELARKMVDAVADALAPFKFVNRDNEVTDDIVGVVQKTWNPLRRLTGGHGIAAVVQVPSSVRDRAALKAFFKNVRTDINSRFVGAGAYKSTHSFVLLLCSHDLFAVCSGVASELKDRSGLHKNIIQGVILVDSETREVTGDYTRPAQNKREYDTLLAAVTSAVQ